MQPDSRLPTRLFVKRLVNKGEWTHLAMIFNFTPRFTEIDGKAYFNWVSAPPAMMTLLFHRPAKPPSVKPPAKPPTPSRRELLWVRQNGVCFYCGNKVEGKPWTLDHVIPRSRGGRHTVGACGPCNHAKANMTLKEFLDTDYLTNERRYALGAKGLPSKKFKDAKKEFNERRSLASSASKA